MKYKISAMVLAIIFFSSPMVYPEFVFLNDGTFVEGKVIEKNSRYMIVRDKKNREWKLKQKDVSMILKSDKLRKHRNQRVDRSSGSTQDPSSDRFITEISFCAFIPSGRFAEISESGYGAAVDFTAENLVFGIFDAGISGGLFFSGGRDLTESKSQDYDSFMFAPLMLSLLYSADLTGNFSLIPALSLGGAWYDVKYTDHTSGPLDSSDRHEKFFGPAAKAGLLCRYRISGNVSLTGGCGYTAVKEESGMIGCVVLSAGAGLIF